MDISLPPPGLPVNADRLLAASAPTQGRPGNAAQIRKTAEEFESQFLSQMLSHMWSGIETDGYFGGGHAEEMFRTLLINEYGNQMTKAGGLGIADQIQQAMLKLQEV